MNDLENTIKERLQQLPEIIRNTILNSEWEEKVRLIVQKNNLRIDQGAVIERDIFLVLLGLMNPNGLEKELAESEIDPETIGKVIAEVDEKIFKDIKKTLIELTEENEAEESETKGGDENEILDRESLLREIEDKPAETAVAAPMPAQVGKPIDTKLQQPTATAVQAVKFDPYREIPE